jgi:hypothetical protein
MKIPKVVYLCGLKFEVVFTRNLKDENSKPLLGLCDVNACKIYLTKGMVEEKKKEVFLHECLHGILENLNIQLGKTEDENEDKVNVLGLELLRFIKVNKIQFDYGKRILKGTQAAKKNVGNKS